VDVVVMEAGEDGAAVGVEYLVVGGRAKTDAERWFPPEMRMSRAFWAPRIRVGGSRR
jgi:hypothetical protein